MIRITNEQRIIAMLRVRPGLDDDELSTATGVTPRQQVNQICRLLESHGLVRREIGLRRKIVNFLQDPGMREQSNDPSGEPVAFCVSEAAQADHPSLKHVQPNPRAFECDPETTLFIFPCSGSKEKRQRVRLAGPSILDELPEKLAQRLAHARDEVRTRAQVDDASLVPAWQRYTGSLYRIGRDAIHAAIEAGVHMIIMSGGYGLVLATEPIGHYEAVFRRSWWPGRILEDVLIKYVCHHNLRTVCALASATTEYAKFIRRVDWRSAALENAWLLTPEETRGAMVKSPRAQGEALSILLRGGLDVDWVSSDGLRLTADRLA